RICVAAGSAAMALFLTAASAHGAAAGHPGYSANLSSNKSLRQQQLLCDPAFATDGSTSTLYYAAISSIQEVDAYPGFGITGVYVQVYTDGTSHGTDTIYSGPPIAAVTDIPSILSGAPETGLVQVYWQILSLPGSAGIAGSNANVVTTDDTNTHTIVFNYLSE